MTERNAMSAVRPPMVAAAAALAALALSGCAGSHVGDAWQCPLAQGEVCASVAAADPAVPERTVVGNLAIGDPLYGQDGASRGADPMSPEQWAEQDCESGCGPLAWLAGLFAGPADAEPGEPGPANAGHSVSGASEADSVVTAAADPDDAPFPDAGEAGGGARADDAPDPAADDTLRTGEVVARIWIAPFVDADGIYREGSWVRVVIAPAAWRLP